MRSIPPVSVSSKWPTPNFVDPVTHGPALDILTSIFIVIVTAILALRLWVRISILKFFGVDDWLMFAAYVSSIVAFYRLGSLLLMVVPL
jgi:multisubunit Na+/H+ antiporter MnhC subunit